MRREGWSPRAGGGRGGVQAEGHLEWSELGQGILPGVQVMNTSRLTLCLSSWKRNTTAGGKLGAPPTPPQRREDFTCREPSNQ